MGDISSKLHQSYRTPAGAVVPSVTGIIGSNLGWGMDALAGWMLKVARQNLDPNAIKERAGAIGTLAHAYIQRYILDNFGVMGTVPQIDEDQWAPFVVRSATVAFGAFKDWLEFTGLVPTWSELQIAHDELGYGGTLDMGARTADGRHDIFVDFKTSSSIKISHIVQVAAYEELYHKHFHTAPHEIKILWLGKDARVFQSVDVHQEQIAAGMRTFRALLAVEAERRTFEQGASDAWWLQLGG